MRIVQLMTDRSRYFNPSKNYWFSFNAFLILLIGLHFRCLSFRVVLVNTARPDGAFLSVVWFIHWKRMIRPFLFIDKQKRKLSIHELVVDFWLANVTKLDDQNRFMQHHCVQTDPAKNVWTRAYLIPERNRTVRRQEEGKNSVYLFVFCMNLGEINALLTISCCQMKHFGYVIVY